MEKLSYSEIMRDYFKEEMHVTSENGIPLKEATLSSVRR